MLYRAAGSPEKICKKLGLQKGRTARTGKKLTQREFVLGLIEAALDEAENRLADTEEDPDANSAENQREEADGTSDTSEPEAGSAEE